MYADLLQRVVSARVWYGVFELRHALLVREALVAEQSGRHDASREDGSGDQLYARVGRRA